MINNAFQRGTFSGFTVKGRCKIVQRIYHTPESKTWFSDSGHFMAVLDDPSLIDNDGKRIPDEKVPNQYIDKQAAPILYTILSDHNGKITHAIDGAVLEKSDIKLHKDEEVAINWNFLVRDHRPGFNDFALLQIFKPDGAEIHHQILYQAVQNTFAWSTGWRCSKWRCPADATIKIRLTIANGYQLDLGIDEDHTTRKNARRFPSGLLLDGIEILKGN